MMSNKAARRAALCFYIHKVCLNVTNYIQIRQKKHTNKYAYSLLKGYKDLPLQKNINIGYEKIKSIGIGYSNNNGSCILWRRY